MRTNRWFQNNVAGSVVGLQKKVWHTEQDNLARTGGGKVMGDFLEDIGSKS